MQTDRMSGFDRWIVGITAVAVASIYELRLDLVHDSMFQVTIPYTSRYIGNITTGDLGILGTYVYLWTCPRFRRFLFRFLFGTWPGLATLLLALVAPILALVAVDREIAYNLKQSLQFAADITIVVQIYAFTFALSKNPMRLARSLCMTYLAILSIGLFLFYRHDLMIVFRTYGDNRILPNMAVDSLQYFTLAYGCAVIMTDAKLGERVTGVLGICAFGYATVIGASRTMFVGLIFVAVILPVLWSLRRRRWSSVFLIACGGLAVFLVWRVMFHGESTNILVRHEGFSDETRVDLIIAGVRMLLAAPAGFLVGCGWDQSGVHNFMVQTLVDAGVIVCGLLMILFLAPLPALWRGYRRSPALSILGFGTLLGFISEYSLNALPTLRVYWIPLGMAIGLSLRTRRAKPPRQTP